MGSKQYAQLVGAEGRSHQRYSKVDCGSHQFLTVAREKGWECALRAFKNGDRMEKRRAVDCLEPGVLQAGAIDRDKRPPEHGWGSWEYPSDLCAGEVSLASCGDETFRENQGDQHVVSTYEYSKHHLFTADVVVPLVTGYNTP